MLDLLLTESRVIVCAGSGGVGKTTISASLGVRAAQLGRRTLVLTVDPAKRLATALGLSLADDQIRAVPEIKDGMLSAAVLDSKRTFDGFIAKHSGTREAGEKILKNRLYQQLSTTLSGSQEFTALERLLAAVESKQFDLVILDTPPTKHAIDFLTAPLRISRLFQDSITRWFMFPQQGSKGLFSSLVGRGTRAVLKSLEVLTGGPFIEELVDFFGSVQAVQQVLRFRSLEVRDLLASDRTQFIVVTGFDSAKLEEAKFLRDELARMSYHLKMVIINRAFPQWLQKESLADVSSGVLSHKPDGELDNGVPMDKPAHIDPTSKLLEFYRRFQTYFAVRYDLYESFEKDLGPSVGLLRVPDYEQDVHGFRDLEKLATKLSELSGKRRV